MEKQQENTFVQGKILQPLIVFALPVLFTLFLQAMYGAMDLLIVGKFASPADVSAVSTGSQIMMTLTNLVSSFAMGTTILLGQQIGCGERKNGGRTVGTAITTVAAQVVSVVVSLAVIRKKELPFEMHRTAIRLHGKTLRRTAGLGAPIALQDLLVSVSFLIILAIVNAMGVTASAGVGVAEKVCAFIMLISSAFMQSISAFVAQNYGAGCMDRARKALHYGAAVSFVIGVGMFSSPTSTATCWQASSPRTRKSSLLRRITCVPTPLTACLPPSSSATQATTTASARRGSSCCRASQVPSACVCRCPTSSAAPPTPRCSILVLRRRCAPSSSCSSAWALWCI